MRHLLSLICATAALAACQREPARDAAADANAAVAATNDVAATPAAGADAQFLADAMKGDNAEVALGQLAQEKSASPAVKTYGKALADDHGTHLQKLIALGAKMGVAATTELSPEGQAGLAKLKALSGAAFDREFKMMMVEDHQKDIAKYQTQATVPGDLGALAKETLPTLQKHLKMAQSLAG